MDSEKALQEEKQHSVMVLQLLKESRVQELLTRTKLNDLLDHFDRMYVTDFSTDSSED